MAVITIRKATSADRTQVLQVEKLSTPGLQYLPHVYELFLSDERGEFSVAEIEGEVVACAKFTVLPDESAWLETIRVVPARQGLGIGKRFYENYFAIAQREGVCTMRMYTGVRNAVSKGLAERFGFQLEETFTEMSFDVSEMESGEVGDFRPISDPAEAIGRIMPHAASWGGYLVMNRTFYTLSPALCTTLAQRGFVYASGDNTVVLGARFMPQTALHLGFFAGDPTACLNFATHQAVQRGVTKIFCLFPSRVGGLQGVLEGGGFRPKPSELIVMTSSV